MNNNVLVVAAAIGGAYWLMRRKKRNPMSPEARLRREEQKIASVRRKYGYSSPTDLMNLAKSTVAGRARLRRSYGRSAYEPIRGQTVFLKSSQIKENAAPVPPRRRK